MQSELFSKTCKICQQFKKIKTIYGHLPPNNIAELKTWDLVHVDLIGPYSKSIIQQHPDSTIIRNNDIMTCTMMIEPATVWFKIVNIRKFNLDEVTSGNNEFIDRSSASVNNTWLFRYPHPRKVLFDNGSEFKRDFATFLKEFNIKLILTSSNNPQANAPVERVH